MGRLGKGGGVREGSVREEVERKRRTGLRGLANERGVRGPLHKQREFARYEGMNAIAALDASTVALYV